MMRQDGENYGRDEDKGGDACQSEGEYPVLRAWPRSGKGGRGRFARVCSLRLDLTRYGLCFMAEHDARPKHVR